MKYLITLINIIYLKKVLLKVKIKKISLLILIYNINNRIIKIYKYIIIKIFIIKIINRKLIIVAIIIKIYLVNNLKANLLINNNIIKS